MFFLKFILAFLLCKQSPAAHSAYLVAASALDTSATLSCLVGSGECQLFGEICRDLSKQALEGFLSDKTPDSLASWKNNAQQLSQIPTNTQDEQTRLSFLQHKWLAKSAGFQPFIIDWVCPCYGFDVQRHPETSGTYARDPSHSRPRLYQSVVDRWKQEFPQDPLILTRPYDLTEYLPAFDNMQTLRQKDVGAIRLLSGSDAQEELLLKWVSNAGLTANWIDLLRTLPPKPVPKGSAIPSLSKADFLVFLEEFSQSWHSMHPQKTLLMEATLNLTRGLCEKDVTMHTQLSELAFANMQKAFLLLNDESLSFFEFALGLETVHGNLGTLLEISSPFSAGDFSAIYSDLLKTPLQGAVHSSAMTSVTGILKCVEDLVGKKPTVFYGPNLYFECLPLLMEKTEARPTTASELCQADLLFCQFHPVFKTGPFDLPSYHLEDVSSILHKALEGRDKPLTLALDCTFDYINSPELNSLLTTFREAIEHGTLAVACYRSGMKFDLFGMDNYYGAPFCLIHNRDAKWQPFERLLNDPVLLTDRLSLNWFCLAYRYAGTYLDDYRKCIFDNTRTLLTQIPASFFNPQNSRYHVVTMDPDVNTPFLDLKIKGPCHKIKGSLLAAYLSHHCFEAGHPFFYRLSLGFYHPNCSVMYRDDCTHLRLTLGLDSDQIEILGLCFKRLDHFLREC